MGKLKYKGNLDAKVVSVRINGKTYKQGDKISAADAELLKDHHEWVVDNGNIAAEKTKTKIEA